MAASIGCVDGHSLLYISTVCIIVACWHMVSDLRSRVHVLDCWLGCYQVATTCSLAWVTVCGQANHLDM